MFSPFQKKKNVHVEDLGIRGYLEDSQHEIVANSVKSEASEELSASILVNKGQMDKRSLDLVFAVEQIIKDKQHVEISHNDLQDRLGHANAQMDRLNKDLKNLGKVIEEREKSILELEQRVTDKNLKVDQMMEDYRELHSTMSSEIEELKSVIELERQNYTGLLQKHNDASIDKNKRIGDLEEKNTRLEAELYQMKQKSDALRHEKTHLLNIVNDFTNRLTSPFAPSASSNDGASTD